MDGHSRTAPPTLPAWLRGPPLTTRTPRFEPGLAAEKLAKKISERQIVAEMVRESHMIETMVHGYRVYKEVWCVAVGKELSCMKEVRTVAIC